MLPGLGAGAGLVALSTMKELPITLLLSPIGFETLVTRTWSRYEEAFLPEAGVVALVLAYLAVYGFTAAGLAGYTRVFGHVFDPSEALIFGMGMALPPLTRCKVGTATRVSASSLTVTL